MKAVRGPFPARRAREPEQFQLRLHQPIIEMQCGPTRFAVTPKSQMASRPFAHRLFVRETDFRLADTDTKPIAGAGTGTGLANVRARLAALYGTDAMLSLMPNQPRGLRIRFGVPQRRPEPSLQSITS